MKGKIVGNEPSLAEILEGSWKYEQDNTSFSLHLSRPPSGLEAELMSTDFSLIRSKTNADKSGILEDINGSFTIVGKALSFDCQTIMIEGWTGHEKEDDGHEEPMVAPYEDENMTGELDLSGGRPVIRMKAFDTEIEFKKPVVSMIHVLASIRVKEGSKAEFIEVFKANVPNVLAEKGCVAYAPAVDVDSGIPVQELDQNTVTIVEQWETLEDLQAHLQAAHMAEYRDKVKDLVDGVALKVLTEV